MEINWESLVYVILLVGGEFWTIRQPIVENVIQHVVDALWGFASRGLGRLWRLIAAPVFLDPGQAVIDLQKIEEELKTRIKGVEVENEVLREKNGAMEKQVVDLQKIEENLKTQVKEVEAENEMLSKRNEILEEKVQTLEKKVVHLQKREEELKDEIKEIKTENKELKLEAKEVKKEIKEVEAEKELMRKRNEVTEKKVGDLQKIEEELKIEIKELKIEIKEHKKEIKEVEAKNEVLRNRNEVQEKKVVDLQKIEEQLKTEKNYINEVAAKNEVLKYYINDAVAKNEVLRKRNEELEKTMVDLQKIGEELKTKIKEAGVENEVLREKNEALAKKLVQSPSPHLGQYQGSFGGQILSLTFDGKLSIIKSNLGEEGRIPLGPWGGSGGVYWAYKLDVAPLMQITLCYGLVIDSILIESKSCDGNVIGCSNRFGGPGGEYTATLCIDSSVEQLLSISLTHGDFCGIQTITSLSFYSNRGKYGPYGRVYGSTVCIPIEGTVLAGFHGRGGLWLDAFGVLVAPRVLNSSHKASGSGVRLEEI